VEDWIEQFLARAEERPGVAEFAILLLAALLEYVVPPVPGDFVVLLGAFLVGAKGWSLPLVLLAVTCGSVLGMSIDYAFGCWVRRHDESWRARSRRWRRIGASIDRVNASYQRWGAVYIAFNRFLPAIRAVFFVAAGTARMPYWKVLVWGVVSSVAWNCLIFAVGVAVGHNREKLFGFFDTYGYVVWGVVVAAAGVILSRWWRWTKRRETLEEDFPR
jgi:membrane-associated protein